MPIDLIPVGVDVIEEATVGEVAVEVTADQLPGTDDTDQAFGLTREQLAALKQIWYEDGHYAQPPHECVGGAVYWAGAFVRPC